MSTALAPAPTRSEVGTTDTVHLWCCDPDLALCGEDVSDVPEVPDGVGVDCVVCVDLEDRPCSPRCDAA